jgi:hypothetical protein
VQISSRSAEYISDQGSWSIPGGGGGGGRTGNRINSVRRFSNWVTEADTVVGI